MEKSRSGLSYDKQHRLLEKRKKRQEKIQKNAERIAGIAIILDKGIVSNLKGNHLLDQIKIFEEGAPNLQGSIPKLANDKRQALVDAVKLYDEGLWVIDKAENWESDGEDFGFEDIDNTTSGTDLTFFFYLSTIIMVLFEDFILYILYIVDLIHDIH